MKPHAEFVFTINDDVLNQPLSVLNEGTTLCCFRAQTCDRDNIEKVIAYGAVKYRRPIGYIPNPRFQAMYDEIYKFALIVVETYIGPQDHPDETKYKACEQWIKLLNQYLHYDMTEVTNSNLATIIADFIFKSSILHSSDHYGFLQVPIQNQPMSIRRFGISKWPRCWCNVVGVWDLFKHNVYSNLFVKWWNNRLYYDTRLLNVKYRFTDKRLQAQSQVYVKNLIEKINEQDIIEPNRISTSIQW